MPSRRSSSYWYSDPFSIWLDFQGFSVIHQSRSSAFMSPSWDCWFCSSKEMSMDAANPERTISREAPRSPATDSPSTQSDMSNNPTPANAAEREQSEQPQSNNLRASASIERGSGLLSAILRSLA